MKEIEDNKQEVFFAYLVEDFFKSLEKNPECYENFNLTSNIDVFDEKWHDHIEPGFDGLEVSDPAVVIFLDYIFTTELCLRKNFQFAQIKLKWNSFRFYANSSRFMCSLMETILNKIYHEKFSKKYENAIKVYEEYISKDKNV